MNTAEITELLKETPTFSIFFDEELAELAALFQPAHYFLGQTVCRAGDVSDAFYLIYSGAGGADSCNGGLKLVDIAHRQWTGIAGRHFGEHMRGC